MAPYRDWNLWSPLSQDCYKGPNLHVSADVRKRFLLANVLEYQICSCNFVPEVPCWQPSFTDKYLNSRGYSMLCLQSARIRGDVFPNSLSSAWRPNKRGLEFYNKGPSVNNVFETRHFYFKTPSSFLLI